MEQDLEDREPGLEKAPVVPEQAKTIKVAAGPRAGEPVKAPPRTPATAAEEHPIIHSTEGGILCRAITKPGRWATVQ